MTPPSISTTLWGLRLGQQGTSVWYHLSSFPQQPARATGGCLNLIKVTGTCLPCCKRLWPILHPIPGRTIHFSPFTMLYLFASLSLRGDPSWCATKSGLFASLAPWWWNKLPTDIRAGPVPQAENSSGQTASYERYILFPYCSTKSSLLLWLICKNSNDFCTFFVVISSLLYVTFL